MSKGQATHLECDKMVHRGALVVVVVDRTAVAFPLLILNSSRCTCFQIISAAGHKQLSCFFHSRSADVLVRGLNRVWESTGVYANDWANLVQYELPTYLDRTVSLPFLLGYEASNSLFNRTTTANTKYENTPGQLRQTSARCEWRP